MTRRTDGRFQAAGFAACLVLGGVGGWSAEPGVWQPDRGDGTYQNPVLQADYSDPDVVRVGDDYWMTASSFSHVPGLPILHSNDLVNWTLAAYALPRLVPEESFRTPQHGKGVWAPAIRFHAGKFWIFYPDPDFGIYVVTATDPRGPWTPPVLVKAGKGLIDPCPLWDDDGKVWLIHAWAKSRAGINNIITLQQLSADASQVIGEPQVIVDGHKLAGYSTLEGPKFYRRDGWYYIFAPAGGVATGWQSVFRSRKIAGPYEDRIVLDQGKTAINGPHQGAWVDTPSGEDWFIHFQDQGAYGRVVHLQPMVWKDGWPVIGDDSDGDGKGQPFLVHQKPALPVQPLAAPATSDEFDSPTLGLQWQWQANPQADWFSFSEYHGISEVDRSLRLFGQPVLKNNLYNASNLLLQKFPALGFSASIQVHYKSVENGDSAGLLVFGSDYAWIGLRRDGSRTKLFFGLVRNANGNPVFDETAVPAELCTPIQLRVEVSAIGLCRFAYSTDRENFVPVGREFKATAGRWVGAKVGLFVVGSSKSFAEFDWFHIEPMHP